LRAAFAAACAERLLIGYAKYSAKTGKSGVNELKRILNRLWLDIGGQRMTDDAVKTFIENCLQLIPKEEGSAWLPEQPAADDAASAVAYALRCRVSGQACEAVCAAQRAYDTLDDYVRDHEGIDTNIPGAEGKILSHPLIQKEFARQRRDLDELLRGSISLGGLRDRARAESPSFIP
jgi:uncharacterized protein YjaG (DUF416 family)